MQPQNSIKRTISNSISDFLKYLHRRGLTKILEKIILPLPSKASMNCMMACPGIILMFLKWIFVPLESLLSRSVKKIYTFF